MQMPSYTNQNADARVIRGLDKREHFMIIRDNFCYFCIKTYVVTPHLNCLIVVIPHRDSSDEGSQHMVSLTNKKIIPQLSSNTPS